MSIIQKIINCLKASRYNWNGSVVDQKYMDWHVKMSEIQSNKNNQKRKIKIFTLFLKNVIAIQKFNVKK